MVQRSLHSTKKSICSSCPRSISKHSFFSVGSNWFLEFLPDPMQPVQDCNPLLPLRIQDHHKTVLSAHILLEPRWTKCRVSTTCYYCTSSGITILSPTNFKPRHSNKGLKTGNQVLFGRFQGISLAFIIPQETQFCVQESSCTRLP